MAISTNYHFPRQSVQVNSLLTTSPSNFYQLNTIPTHPQLRDLLISPSSSHNSFLYSASHDSIARYSLLKPSSRPRYSPLSFTPCSITNGSGLIAAGGQAGELAILSEDTALGWCFQTNTCPADEVGSINNSISIVDRGGHGGNPRLLIPNNDMTVKIYDVDFSRSRIEDMQGLERLQEEEDEDEEDDEEDCTVGVTRSSPSRSNLPPPLSLTKVTELSFPTPINHCTPLSFLLLPFCSPFLNTSELKIHRFHIPRSKIPPSSRRHANNLHILNLFFLFLLLLLSLHLDP